MANQDLAPSSPSSDTSYLLPNPSSTPSRLEQAIEVRKEETLLNQLHYYIHIHSASLTLSYSFFIPSFFHFSRQLFAF